MPISVPSLQTHPFLSRARSVCETNLMKLMKCNCPSSFWRASGFWLWGFWAEKHRGRKSREDLCVLRWDFDVGLLAFGRFGVLVFWRFGVLAFWRWAFGVGLLALCCWRFGEFGVGSVVRLTFGFWR